MDAGPDTWKKALFVPPPMAVSGVVRALARLAPDGVANQVPTPVPSPEVATQETVVQTVLVVFGMVTVTAPLDAGKCRVVILEDAPNAIWLVVACTATDVPK